MSHVAYYAALTVFEVAHLIPRIVYWGAVAGFITLSALLFTGILGFVVFDLLIQSGF